MTLHIGAIQKSSLIDYPGKISAVVFTLGCNFRCPYCHNPELVEPHLFPHPILGKEILQFLETRKGKLDAVVITGGEATLQKGLLNFMSLIKGMGYLVKLDTNGSMPQIIQEAVEKGMVDYIAMDIKAPLDKYGKVVMSKIDTKDILHSIQLIMDSGIEYEFRTTLLRSLLSPDDIIAIGELIKGARLYMLQKFVSSKALDQTVLSEQSFSDDEVNVLQKQLHQFVKKCGVR
jgi:pyruvate formate lyase activating enzyme